jgi:hypothetical protein
MSFEIGSSHQSIAADQKAGVKRPITGCMGWKQDKLTIGTIWANHPSVPLA